ncbi:hypothetical protein CDAR_306531 [Caerostris darwini]|uniref:Uncharacterized protein n=1 Tax=Caerostris darwini TaxID=1538125 RepID=A0AAV4SUT8_9ARAC|nr:hypothetical protein CDAR_306531 [Caerostris darwini]
MLCSPVTQYSKYNAAIPCRHRRSLSSPITLYQALDGLHFCSVLKTRRSSVSDKELDAIFPAEVFRTCDHGKSHENKALKEISSNQTPSAATVEFFT